MTSAAVHATHLFGARWHAATAVALDAESVADGPLLAARRSVRRLVPRQSIKGGVKSALAGPLEIWLAASVGRLGCAVGAATLGAVVAALALNAVHGRADARGTARRVAGKTALKTIVSGSAKLLLKQHTMCGPVLTAACSTALGIACRNWVADVLSGGRPKKRC